MILTKDEYKAIAWGGKWKSIGPKEIVSEHRWYNQCQLAYENQTTKELIVVLWCEGRSEDCDLDYVDYPAEKFPAEAYEFIETRYRAVKNDD